MLLPRKATAILRPLRKKCSLKHAARASLKIARIARCIRNEKARQPCGALAVGAAAHLGGMSQTADLRAPLRTKNGAAVPADSATGAAKETCQGAPHCLRGYACSIASHRSPQARRHALKHLTAETPHPQQSAHHCCSKVLSKTTRPPLLSLLDVVRNPLDKVRAVLVLDVQPSPRTRESRLIGQEGAVRV